MLKPAHLSRIDLNLLVLFHVVYEERHVTRAAERLNLTPSAVSHGLGRLRRLLNDPLFLRTPKGVAPSARANELAAPVSDIIARAGAVIASAEPFDPARSRRRFVIGAPDAISSVLLTFLLGELERRAPGVDISLAQLLPQGGQPGREAWQRTLVDLESRALDIIIAPIDAPPPRFAAYKLFDADFVVAMRKGHPFARDPSLKRFCAMRHLLVSMSGDPYGVVDAALAERGMTRRVALTVPSFMMALATLAETDLVAAVPRVLIQHWAPRLGLVFVDLPILKRRDPIRAVATKAAMMDAGVAWLLALLKEMSWPGDAPRPTVRARRVAPARRPQRD